MAVQGGIPDNFAVGAKGRGPRGYSAREIAAQLGVFPADGTDEGFIEWLKAPVTIEGENQVLRVIAEGDTQVARVIAEGNFQIARLQDFVDDEFANVVMKTGDQTMAGSLTTPRLNTSALNVTSGGAFVAAGLVYGMSGYNDFRTYAYSPLGTDFVLRVNNTNRLDIATGGQGTYTGNFTVTGELRSDKHIITGSATFGTVLTETAQLYRSTTLGLVIAGAGTTNDVTLTNRAGLTVFSVPGNTQNINFAGTVGAGGATAQAAYGARLQAPTSTNLALALIGFDANSTILFRPGNAGVNLITSDFQSAGPNLPLALSGRATATDLQLRTDGTVSFGVGAVFGSANHAIRQAAMGYGGAYTALQIGNPGASTELIALGVNVGGVAGGSFVGGQIAISNQTIIAPNGADWTGVLRSTGGKVYVGGAQTAAELTGTALVVDNATSRVGVGVTTPSGKFHVQTPSGERLMIGYNGTDQNYFDGNVQSFRNNSAAAIFMISNSGPAAVVSFAPELRLQRDDAFASFYSTAGVRQGYIQSSGGNIHIHVDGAGQGWRVDGGAAHWLPSGDAILNHGSSSYRINNSFYAVAPTIGSDINFKWVVRGNNIGALVGCDAEKSPGNSLDGLDYSYLYPTFLKLRRIVYWDRMAYEEKGELKARFHFGYSANDVQALFEADGFDVTRFGFWCSDVEEEEVDGTEEAWREKVVDGKVQYEDVPVLDDNGEPKTCQRPKQVEDGTEDYIDAEDPSGPTLKSRPKFKTAGSMVQLKDADGNLLFRKVTVPATEDEPEHEIDEAIETFVPELETVPVTERKPVMEKYDRPCKVRQPKADGSVRLSLRYQELHEWMLAALDWKVQQLETRLEALENV